MANGWGSRQRGKIVYKGTQSTPKHEDNSMALIPVVENDMELLDAKPLVSTCETLQGVHPKKPISRLVYFLFTISLVQAVHTQILVKMVNNQNRFHYFLQILLLIFQMVNFLT